MRQQGTIETWNDEKGYGFIKSSEGGPKIFVHIKAFTNRNRRPISSDSVTFETAKDDQGRLNAVKAELDRGKSNRRSGPIGRTPAIFFSLLFLCALAYLTYIGNIQRYILYWYLGASLFAFIAYAKDKFAARRGRWRTPEGTLHLLGLVGGWPGALIAQETFRHKSRKTSFQVIFAITFVLNCAALIWLHTVDGQALLNQLIQLG